MCLRSAVLALTLAAFVLVVLVVVALFNPWDHFFFSFFKSFKTFGLASALKLSVAVTVLGLRLGLGLSFTFSMFLPSLLHSHCALLQHYRWQIKKFANNAMAYEGQYADLSPVANCLKKRKWIRIRLSWHNSNKTVTLSSKRCTAHSVMVMRYGRYDNGFRFDSHLAHFHFVLLRG